MKTTRVLTIVAMAAAVLAGASTSPAEPMDAAAVIADVPPVVPLPEKTEATAELRADLAREVEEYLDGFPWAPFYCSIGIGSRDFAWAHPSFSVTALATAYPYLPEPLAARARTAAVEQLAACLAPRPLPLDQGTRRELFSVNPGDLYWPQDPNWPQISHVYAIWLYGHRTGDWDSVRTVWPGVQALYRAHVQQYQGRYEPQIFQNRLAAGLIGYARLAQRFGTERDVATATADLQRVLDMLAGYWRQMGRVCGQSVEQVRGGTRPGRTGTAFFMQVPRINHQSKMAIFMDLTPSLANALAAAEPEAVDAVRQYAEIYFPTYYLAYEDRQVHYGENFIDLPDGVHGLFLANAWLWNRPAELLARHTDIPWVKADLFHIEKLAIALHAAAKAD